jgi:Leucine-rich repeat (LRR) protein
MIQKLTALALIALLMSFTSPEGVNEDYCPSTAPTLYSMEEALAAPAKAEKLDISMLKLKAIPASIGQLENLVCLDLAFNLISTLPPEITKLKKLQYLNLAGTRYMAKVPVELLKQLPSLKVLNIADHPEWPAARFEEVKKALPNVKVITTE